MDYESCWDKSRTANEMFSCNQIIPAIEIFSDKDCQTALGFEYIYLTTKET